MTVYSATPAIIDALVAAARLALQDVLVYDGYGLSDDPGDILMVGVDDPDSVRPANAGESFHEWAAIGGSRTHDQQGTVTCAALAWSGDMDPKAVRDRAYAIVSEVAQILRDTPALGVPSVAWCTLGQSETLSQNIDDAGCSALVVFSIRFRARI